MSLNFNFIKLNDQADKLIRLDFRMINLNANMVNVNKKSYTNVVMSAPRYLAYFILCKRLKSLFTCTMGSDSCEVNDTYWRH